MRYRLAGGAESQALRAQEKENNRPPDIGPRRGDTPRRQEDTQRYQGRLRSYRFNLNPLQPRNPAARSPTMLHESGTSNPPIATPHPKTRRSAWKSATTEKIAVATFRNVFWFITRITSC